MTGFSTYEAQAFINTMRAETLYVALFTADPTDDNITANEVTGAWYARQALGALSAPTGSVVSTSNSNQITFPAVTGSSVSVTYMALYDALTGGNLRYSWQVTDSGGTPVTKIYAVGDVPVFPTNAIEVTFN